MIHEKNLKKTQVKFSTMLLSFQATVVGAFCMALLNSMSDQVTQVLKSLQLTC
jgi:hypothetical protein